MAFQLDTSGEVIVGGVRYTFDGTAGPGPHLSPFAQGYTEALFASMRQEDDQPVLKRRVAGGLALDHFVGFDILAPETLERIMEDCAAIKARIQDRLAPQITTQAGYWQAMGAAFWRDRQDGEVEGFPPLTPDLGDDGKVYLREAA